MEKGLTTPCPSCKNVLFRNAFFRDRGTFQMLCPHCKELIEVTMKIRLVANTRVIAKEIKILLILLIPIYAYMTYQLFSNPSHRIAEEIKEVLNNYVFTAAK